MSLACIANICLTLSSCVMLHGRTVVSGRSGYVTGLETEARSLGCHLVPSTKELHYINQSRTSSEKTEFKDHDRSRGYDSMPNTDPTLSNRIRRSSQRPNQQDVTALS
ncbi:hypothetical protein V6N13_141696 [Hibiscus sabdariffa]